MFPWIQLVEAVFYDSLNTEKQLWEFVTASIEIYAFAHGSMVNAVDLSDESVDTYFHISSPSK